MNRRGLSPLTSTILLLVVSIIIGIIVMTWGRSYIEDVTSQESVLVSESEPLFEDLDNRLSRGEISQEQYDTIKQVLLEQNS